MQDPVLYRNETWTVILLDLPASIEHGQQSPYTIISSRALQDPYPSTEPKGRKWEAAINAVPVNDRVYHAAIQRDISSALGDIANSRGPCDSWCHPRALAFQDDHDSMLPELSLLGDSLSPQSTDQWPVAVSVLVPVVLSTTDLHTRFPSLQNLHGNVVCNVRPTLAVVEVPQIGDFVIPPKSVFILGSLESGLPAFLGAARALLPPPLTVACSAGATSCHYHHRWDLILMDPPWSNRSVRHSRSYTTSETQSRDPFQQATRIVKDYLAPGGLVGIWITNKASVRSGVLEELRSLGFSLLEEWSWVKTTATGLPVTQLDGVWRRPYEVFLLFRQGQSRAVPIPRRRVIAAVPDIHSRKPCLKILLDDLLPPQYTALELFARSLTAGWWSWGDEVLKFQHESQWVGLPQGGN